MPAVDRYDGPAFRVLRRFLRESSSEVPDIRVLSAEHGLIPYDLPIANYDRVMTASRACELRPHVIAELSRVIDALRLRDVFILAGRVYLNALSSEKLPLSLAATKVSNSAQGGKLSELYDWLWRNPPELRYNSRVPAIRGRPRIKGVEVSSTPQQVLEVARRALAEDWGDPERYEAWYVEVEGTRVAPKWLVSRLSGLPVRSFHSDDARRLLNQLGVEVSRL